MLLSSQFDRPGAGLLWMLFYHLGQNSRGKKYVLVKYKNKHRNCEIKYKNNFTNISKKLQAIPSFQKIENIQNQIKDFFHFSGLVSVTSRAFFQKNFS